MREIKFRAWGNAKRKMYYADFAINPDGTTKTWGIYERLILMQYTGLKDRNGKEIYEGDIINIQSDPDIPSEYNKTVVWVESNLAWNINPPRNKQRVIVIGNIYENPELLKDGQGL